MAEFDHNGVSYRLIPTTEWDFRDALFGKQASGGMSVLQVEQGVMQADPDACIAMMAVSLHRDRTTATAEKLRDEIVESGLRVVDWFEQLDRSEIGDTQAVMDGPPEDAAEAATPSPTTTTPEPSGALVS